MGDKIIGDSGDNYLVGGEGDDTLNGGAGADTMAGAAGNDLYLVDNVGDVGPSRIPIRATTPSGVRSIGSSARTWKTWCCWAARSPATATRSTTGSPATRTTMRYFRRRGQ